MFQVPFLLSPISWREVVGFFFFKLFSAHFLLRIFLSTAAVLTFHEYGETIRGGGIFPHSLEQCLSMSRHMCCYSSETVVTSGFGSVCGEAGS